MTDRAIKPFFITAAILVAVMGCAQIPFTVDTSFNVDILNTSQTYGVMDIELLPNGLIATGTLDCGWNPWPAGAPRGLVRLNLDGSRDMTFNDKGPMGLLFPWDYGYYGGANAKPGRLDFDGNFDVGHVQDAFLSPFIEATHCYPMADSTLIMGGKYRIRSRVDSSYLPGSFCITKLDKEGEPDTTFQHRSCSGASVGLIEPMADGRLFLSGAFGVYDGQSVNRLFRIWPDGSLDTTFHTTIDWGAVHGLHQLPNGSLLCSGNCRFPDQSNDTLGIFRLLPNGTLDTTYNSLVNEGGALFKLDENAWVLSIRKDSFQGQSTGQLVVLDSTGNRISHPLDSIKLDPIVHGNNNVGFARIKKSANGSLYLYGGFSGIDDGNNYYPNQRFITRLHGLTVGVNDVILSSSKAENALALFPNPGNEQVNIAIPFTTHNGIFQVYNQQGRLVNEEQVMRNSQGMFGYDSEALPSGIYTFIMLTNTGEKWSGKWVKE